MTPSRLSPDPAQMISAEIEGRVATVTLGFGERHNALPPACWSRLSEVVSDLSSHEDISVVVFRGAGQSFSAGFDLRYWEDANIQKVDADFAAVEVALHDIERIPVPTIAAVQGVATGGGCMLALACDMRVAADTSRMGMPIIRLGMLTSPFFFNRLAAAVGNAKARELLYLGDLLNATEAERAGLATKVVPENQLEDAIDDITRRLSEHPISGLVAAKRAATETHPASSDEPGIWNYAHETEFPKRLRQFLTRKKRATDRKG